MAQWPCQTCSFLNHAEMLACEICSSPCASASTSLETIQVIDLTQEANGIASSPVQSWEAAFDERLHGLSQASLEELCACLERGRSTDQASADLGAPLLALGWHERNGAWVMHDHPDARQRLVKASNLLFYASLVAVQAQVEQETNARIQQAQAAVVIVLDKKDGDGDEAAKLARVPREPAANAGASASATSPRSQPLTVRVRLVLPDGLQLNVSLDGNSELIYLLVVPDVQRKLCALLGLHDEALSAQKLAKHFSLVGPPPDRTVYDVRRLQRVKIQNALPGGDGVMRMQTRDRTGVQLTSSLGLAYASDVSIGVCDRVVVIRLRCPPHQIGRRGRRVTKTQRAEIGSPVLLFKNYNRDRGVRLMGEFHIKIQQIVQGQAHHSMATVGNLEVVQHCGEAVLRLCRDLPIIKADKMALDALSDETGLRYGWHQPVGLAYPRGSSLHHHVDNTGGWVVLFSFGLTCDFHVGGRTIDIESGDALVFNGGTAHQVMHGLDRVYERPTYKGSRQELPTGILEQLKETRVSIQVRQVR